MTARSLIRGVRGRKCASKRVPWRPIERPYVILDLPVEWIVATREPDRGSPQAGSRVLSLSLFASEAANSSMRVLIHAARSSLDVCSWCHATPFSSKSPISHFVTLASKGELLCGSRIPLEKSSATNHLIFIADDHRPSRSPTQAAGPPAYSSSPIQGFFDCLRCRSLQDSSHVLEIEPPLVLVVGLAVSHEVIAPDRETPGEARMPHRPSYGPVERRIRLAPRTHLDARAAPEPFWFPTLMAVHFFTSTGHFS